MAQTTNTLMPHYGWMTNALEAIVCVCMCVCVCV